MAIKSKLPRSFDPFGTASVWFSKYKYSIAIVLGLVVIWTVWSEYIDNRGDLYLPSPDYVIVQTLANLDRLITATWITTVHILTGFIIAISMGVLTAIILSEFFVIRQMSMPTIVYTYSIPHAIVAPLFLVIFGNNLFAIALFVAWGGFFAVLINTLTGLTQVEEELHQLAAITGATRWQKLRKIKIWVAMPHISAGVKIAIQQSIVGAIIAEFIATGNGLGHIIIYAAELLRGGLLWGSLIVLLIFASIMFYTGAWLLEFITPGT